MTTDRNIRPAIAANAGASSPEGPWWKVGALWLVIGGPLAVVVASIVTAVIAWHGADEVLNTQRPAAGAQSDGGVPAVQARNHAATGGR